MKITFLWFFLKCMDEGRPKIGSVFSINDGILSFSLHMQFMGYMQYKICVGKVRPIYSTIRKRLTAQVNSFHTVVIWGSPVFVIFAAANMPIFGREYEYNSLFRKNTTTIVNIDLGKHFMCFHCVKRWSTCRLFKWWQSYDTFRGFLKAARDRVK